MNIPTPRSRSQILGQTIGTFVSKTGIARLKIANPILSIFEAVSQSQLRSSADIFNMLSSINLDNATGLALVRIGTDENVPKITAKSATGYVTIVDTSFIKISSQIYQGTGAPISGSTSINIANASSFPNSGSIYIGRNTENYEGPLSYSSKVNNISYWTLILTSPTNKFHNLGEPVVLSQGGNRSISAGTVVQTSQGNTVQAVQYKTIYAAIIPDGETTVENIFISALRVGTTGNVDINAISQFVSPPFSGAIVFNPNTITNGVDTETDPQYRERIRIARQTRALGTKLAIKNAAVNTFSVSENKSVISSSYITRIDQPDVLYIDDGTGYEELPIPVNYDTIVADAVGGEQYLSVDSPTPISKAFITTTLSAPFSLVDGAKLSVLVGNQFSEHFFQDSSFKNISAASAFEVSASINGNSSLLFSARTASNGTKVSIFAKQSLFERIQVLVSDEIDANDFLGFSLNIFDTLKLYKNDQLLIKDGAPAVLLSNPFGLWQSLSGTATLMIAVDGTPTITYTFTDSDFIDSNTGYITLGNNSLNAWSIVINNKIPGITCSVVGSRLQLISNVGNNLRAEISITGGSLVSDKVFEIQDVIGLNNDYAFDRNIGQIKLTEPLETGDSLTGGSFNTRAFIQSDDLTTVNLSSDAQLWFGLDSDYELVNTGIVGSSVLSVDYSTNTNPWAYRIRISSSGSVFNNVEVSDQVIIWDTSFNSSLLNTWRVVNKNPNWIEFDKTNCNARRSNAAFVKLADGKLLVCGGYSGKSTNGLPISSAEIYDPIANIWSPVAPMSIGRSEHSATLLNDNRVLVVGGFSTFWDDSLGSYNIQAVNNVEIYDPTMDTWTTVASLPRISAAHVASLLKIGPNVNKVLIAGGNSTSTAFTSCYLYDVTVDSWAATGSLTTAKSNAASCKLGNDTILVAGGISVVGTTISNTATIYNPVTGTWSAAGTISVARYGGNMVWNPNQSKAELVGGYTTIGTSPTASAVLDRYDLGGGTWSVGASAPFALVPAAWVFSTNGKIIAVGGDGTTVTVHTMIYDPAGNSWSSGLAPPSNYNYSQSVAYESSANIITISHGRRTKNVTDFADYSAVSYLYHVVGNTWSYTDPSINPAVTLANGGLIIARNKFATIISSIPAGSNYTASSLVDELNNDLLGSQAQTYKTNKIRVLTNTQSISNGGIGLITTNTTGKLLDIFPSNEIHNLIGHAGSVESGVGEIDIPYIVRVPAIGYSDDSIDINWIKSKNIDSGLNVLFGLNSDTESGLTNSVNYDYGQRHWTYSQIKSAFSTVSESLILREYPLPIVPNESLHFMYPYKFSAYDSLNVLIDNDLISKNFDINMWRTLTTQGTTYSLTNTFVDGDNGDISLANAFGYGSNSFDFKDFAIHMSARTKTFLSDSTKSILYRFRKLGPDGNNTLFEYILPSGPDLSPDQHVVIDTPLLNSKNLIQISLGSGSAVTGISLTGSAKIGYSNVSSVNGIDTLVYALGLAVTSASITSNVVTLVLTLPPSVTDHGIIVGDYIYFSGSGIFTAGLYYITARSATTVSYSFTHADVGATPITATVSLDIQTATFAGSSPSLTNGQFFRITSNSELNNNFADKTIRVSNHGDQYVSGVIRDQASLIPVNTTLTWSKIVDPAFLMLFDNSLQSAGTIASFFDESTINPGYALNATVLGDGSGIIDRSTAEQESDGSFYYELTDGLNYVKSVTNPVTIVQNYSFTFKDPINADLATNSDWANEVLRIVPVTTKNCVDWFNSQGVTGLNTVANIERSSLAQKVQITTNSIGSQGSVKVLGGSANSSQVVVYGAPEFSVDFTNQLNNWFALKVKTESAKNLISGSKVLVQNTKNMSRPGPWSSGSGTISISSQNGLIISSSSLFGSGITRTENSGIGIEKLNAGYAIVHNYAAVDGGWIYIDTPKTVTTNAISSANKGLFRVVRSINRYGIKSTIIQNSNAIEEYNVDAGLITILDVDQIILPNDYFSINTNSFGTQNIGKRTVLSVGKSYVSLPPSSLIRTGGSTVTVSCPYAHGLTAIDSFTLSPGESLFPSGTKNVTSIIDSTHFTYTEVGTNATSSLNQTIEGFAFQNNKIFRLDITEFPMSSISGVVLNSTEGLKTSVIESTPESMIKEIVSIIPTTESNLLSGELYSIIKLTPIDDVFATVPVVRASEEAGTVIKHLTKLDFSNNISVGIDAYNYSGGLIEEVAKVLYGDETDIASYPGVIAGGNSIEISGPLIKRISITGSVRLKAGLPTRSVINKVKSAIASVINQTNIGDDISLSDIVEAANRVSGVLSFTIDSPIYNNANDLIIIQEFEKPLVLDVDSDIQISIIGN